MSEHDPYAPPEGDGQHEGANDRPEKASSRDSDKQDGHEARHATKPSKKATKRAE